MRGRLIEPLEDLEIPDGQELIVSVSQPELPGHSAVVAALVKSAGTWSDTAHPELATRSDVIGWVASVRADFERANV